MFGLSPTLDKKGILAKVRCCIEKAGDELGVASTPQYAQLQIGALKLTDYAARALHKKNGWDVKHLNEHCRKEILASYVCFISYFSLNPKDKETRKILKEGARVGLKLADITSGDSPAKSIEIAVITAMIKILKEDDLDAEEFLGLSKIAI